MSAICDEMCRTGADMIFKRKEWIETCKKFLLKEKEFARLRELASNGVNSDRCVATTNTPSR
jgi:hypothetical protein